MEPTGSFAYNRSAKDFGKKIMNETQANSVTSTEARKGIVPIWIKILVIVGFLISVYLLGISFVSAKPLGCGEESGCAEVLTSRWSQVFGIPVSALAMVVYIGLAVSVMAVNNPHTARMAGHLAATLAVVLIAGAFWFIGLQLFYLKAICPWCMAEHAVGVLVGCGLLWSVTRHLKLPLLVPGSVAILGLVGLICAQSFGSYSGPSAERGLASDTDTVSGEGDQKTVSLLDGKLKFNLAETPLIGEPESERVVVVLFDYCCPHCRATHEYLLNARQKFGQQLSIALLPMPLNSDCNPHWKKTEKRFLESCDLAKLALAVFRCDKEKFVEFDKWLFEPSKPRLLVDVRAHAESLVDAQQLDQALADPWIDEFISMTTDAYASSDAERIPVLLSPGFSSVVGRPGSEEELMEILETELGLKESVQ